jgi:hypothetical protein
MKNQRVLLLPGRNSLLHQAKNPDEESLSPPQKYDANPSLPLILAEGNNSRLRHALAGTTIGLAWLNNNVANGHG